MKKLMLTGTFLWALFAFSGATVIHADDSGPPPGGGSLGVVNANQINNQYQNQSVIGPGYSYAEGSDALAEGGDATAGAVANISTTSVAKTRARIPPLTVYPPYLPYWQHGGWGTLKAYFPTGPNGDDQAYQRAFNPDDPDDMRELKGVVESLPYDGPLDVLGGILNGVGVVFGGPDNFHHGRGFEIASAIVRDRRPAGKPLLVFIDSNVDRQLLREAGYTYVGKVSIEGKIERNWDHAYDAAVAEALPWDVDILLISGGMKGVTVGSNISFPGAGYGYSQTNYSLSVFGGYSSGITEGKGKALVSAEGYRYWPEAAFRRGIPKCLYDRIRVRPKAVQPTAQAAQAPAPVTTTTAQVGATRQPAGQGPEGARKQEPAGVKVSRELYDLAGFDAAQRVDHMAIR